MRFPGWEARSGQDFAHFIPQGAVGCGSGRAACKIGHRTALQAHLFVFWFALLSTITPPVCGTVFIASGMVGENWLRVAVMSMALGIGLYLIPLGMIANPSLIELAESPMTSVAAALKLAVALSAISYGLIAPKPPLLRAALTLAGGVVLFAFGI